jgi:peroxiredoxin
VTVAFTRRQLRSVIAITTDGRVLHIQANEEVAHE